MRTVITLILVCGALDVRAETFTMTTSDDWTVLEAAQAGDVVEIAPGTYQFRVYLDNAGDADTPIIIRAQDPNNRPVWDLDGMLVNEWDGSYTAGDNHRGCWQVAAEGAYYEISGIEFRNCRASSSAGIRMINSGPVTLRDCVFHHNTNGVTGASTGLLIEFSEFYENGKTITTGNMTHNMYIYGGDLTVRYSYFHDGHEGQHFHVRARVALLEYNWFARAAGYTGDIMTCEHFCGGSAQNPITQWMTLRGNVILQGDTPGNASQILALLHDETGGSTDDTGMVGDMDITLIHNTVIGTAREVGRDHRLINFRNDTVGCHAHVHNNIIADMATVVGVREPATINWSVEGTNNWVTTGTDAAGLTATIEGTDPGFVNADGLDFTLTSARGGSNTGIAGVPDREYYRDEALAMQYRARASTNDRGAFEYGTSSDPIGPYGTPLPPADGAPTADGGMTDGAAAQDGMVTAGDERAGGDEDTPALSGGCGCRESAGVAWFTLVASLPLMVRRSRRSGDSSPS